MKQYLLAMFFLLTFVSSHAMNIDFKPQDRIKGTLSTQYNQKTTALYKRLLEITNQELTKDTLSARQKRSLEKNRKGIQESLDQVDSNILLTYSLLQEGNRLWIEEHQAPKKSNDLDFYFSTTKKEYEQLHEMYVIIRNKAYEQIAAQLAPQTKKFLSQLRTLHRKTLFSETSKKTRKTIIKKIEALEKLEQSITQLPTNTYLVLQRLNTINQNSSLTTDSSYGDILNKLHSLYEYVIKPGFFE